MKRASSEAVIKPAVLTSALDLFYIVVKYPYLSGGASEAYSCNSVLLHICSRYTSCCDSLFSVE